MKNRCSYLLFILSVLAFLSANLGISGTGTNKAPAKTYWTIMHYGGTDNDNDEMIIPFYKKMKSGFIDAQGLELIILADRNPKYSNDQTVFGENFSDTRLYRITHEKTERLDGGAEFPEITRRSKYEANTADALTLKKFIRFCKSHYPAEHYALVFFSHGGGPHMCYDEGSKGDALYTAEITDVLGAQESVDLIVFDVCLMGGVENAYQWRPGKSKFGAQAMVASAPSSGPWAYDKVFERLRSGGGDNGEDDTMAGGKERYCDPAVMTALEFGGVIMEEIYDGQPEESWACYDLTKVDMVKRNVDTIAAALAKESEKDDFESIRGIGCITRTLNYMYYMYGITDLGWLLFPYFDLYDLAKQTTESPAFSLTIRLNAEELMKAVDELVVCSYAGDSYPGFEKGKHGIYIFFPDGDRHMAYLNRSQWSLQTWYNPLKILEAPEGWPPKEGSLPEDLRRYFTYGHYLWCSDGATPGNNKVENWFELMDSWYDTGNGPDGGLNKCRW